MTPPVLEDVDLIRAKSTRSGSRYDVTARCPDITRSFFYEIDGDVIPPEVERQDFVALALVFLAMRRHWDLHIDGRVSRQLLINLDELMAAWHMWMPAAYTPIRITASEEVDDVATADRSAVCAFSGGVDATFALIRHWQASGRSHCPLVAAVLVHGFDIHVEQQAGFAMARQNAEAMVGAIGVPLAVVRTNWRQAVSEDWEQDFGAGLAACLSLFSSVASIGLLGSDEDYAHFVLPWGSNPITNHLLSSGSFRLITEGGGFTRTQKVAEISKVPAVAERLRVCWQGPQTGRNCGVCEKCMRTKLNFLAVGGEIPLGLGEAPSVKDILGILARNKVQVSYLVDIAEHARRTGVSKGTRAALQVTLLKNRAINLARSSKRLKRWVRRIALASAGSKPT